MFMMKEAMLCITQAATYYAMNTQNPTIEFSYMDQAGHVFQMDELKIEVQSNRPSEIIRNLLRAVPYTIKKFDIDENLRYLVVQKIDTSTPHITVQLKTILRPMMSHITKTWDETFRRTVALHGPWEDLKS